MAALCLAAAICSGQLTDLRLGTHAILEVYSAPFATLNSSALVRRALTSAAQAGNFSVVSESFHAFPVQGVSGLLLVSESHLSIHTWPEHGYAALDLFTCGEASPTALPCGPFSAAHFDGALGWRCDNGANAHANSGIWEAIGVLVARLDAGRAMLTWLERGLPKAPGVASPPSRARGSFASQGEQYGALGGLEGPNLRVEL